LFSCNDRKASIPSNLVFGERSAASPFLVDVLIENINSQKSKQKNKYLGKN